MSNGVREVLGGVAASLVAWVVVEVATDVSTAYKAMIVAAVAVVVVVAMLVLGRRRRRPGGDRAGSESRVASDITADGNIGIDGVDASSSESNTSVASDLDSGGDVTISDIKFRHRGPNP